MSLISQMYRNICLILLHCLLVGAKLYLASKLIENTMSDLVEFARYISTPIALRYGTSGPNNSLFSYLGRNGSLFTSSEQTTTGESSGCDLST